MHAAAALVGDIGEAFADLAGAAEHDRLDPDAQRILRGPGIVPAIEQRGRDRARATELRAVAIDLAPPAGAGRQPGIERAEQQDRPPASAAACSAATACASE